MSTLGLIFIIIGALVLGGVIFSFFFCRSIAKKVYFATLVRETPEKWGRCCSDTTNEEQVSMWNEGLAWARENEPHMSDVQIENEGFNLYGQFFDFGSDKAVIIIPGRTESLMYSYYFAAPYKEAGCSVLVIDIRSHGLSDGKYDYIGVGEDRDVIKWAQLLHESFGIQRVIIHGICMGASTGIQVLTSPGCPDYICGQVSEGCYISFYESYRQHMIQDKHPTFPVLPMVMHMIKSHTGTDVSKTRPIDFISRVRVPFLFLCGRKDPFSLPARSQELFEKCGSAGKEIRWFDKGNHSHLRIANTEEFDEAIIGFVHKYFD